MPALIMVLLAGSFALALNKVVHTFIPSFLAQEEELLNARISFRAARYVFPDSIIVDNITITPARNTPPQPMLQVRRAQLGFSFPLLSARGKIHLSRMALDHPVVRLPALKSYLARNGARILAEFRSLPDADMQINLTRASFYILDDKKTDAPVILDMDLGLKNGQFTVKLKDQSSFLQLWGGTSPGELDARGFMFYDGPLSPVPVYVLDINTHARINGRALSLDHLSFTINDDSVAAKGSFLLNAPFTFAASLAWRRTPAHVTPQAPWKAISTHVHGRLIRQAVVADGDINMALLPQGQYPLQDVRLTFKALQATLINDKLWRLKSSHAGIELLAGKTRHRISLDNVFAGISPERNARFNATASCGLYGGTLKGRIDVDGAQEPWQTSARANIDGVNIHRLSEADAYFDRCEGELAGVFDWRGPRDLLFNGTVALRQGDLKGLDLLPWNVPELFQMPSLNHLSHAELSLRFMLSGPMKTIDNIKLRSDIIGLDGFFHLTADERVASQMAILFSAQALGESPVGQKILTLVPNAWTLPFEFRLSGNLHRMNFQWMDSPFKRKIEQHLPAFIRRSIERKIDRDLEQK